ncbi:hypothetical protein NE562_14450 [Butyricicoccus faecihominis]|nr:hypothetical protein [Butyricicoccus faecihominis]MCQ5130862.1 hypothetical protein [Butyricicoccus faecihominis]
MDDNKRFLDHLGVTAWHAAGWTGSRGLTATGEELGAATMRKARKRYSG